MKLWANVEIVPANPLHALASGNIDMVRTRLNVCGGCRVSVLIARSEKELDLTVYYAQKARH